MGTQLPPEKGHTHPTKFLAHVYCGQMAGWMNTPLGTEVELGTGHIVLDVVPAVRERGTAVPPLFSSMFIVATVAAHFARHLYYRKSWTASTSHNRNKY